MKKSLLYAIALGGLTVSAQAADLSLDSVKDPLPDTLAWHGITFYGTIDVGYAGMSNGLPASGAFYVGPSYTIYGSKYASGGVSTITNNALSQSQVGIKFEEEIGYGLKAIGKLDTGFNPISGEISDACASIQRANPLVPTNSTTPNQWYKLDNYGDGSRCGQAFNGNAYGGLSSPLYGTLTVGRQNSLVNDGMGVYDPMGLSYAFSLIGYSGTPGAGIGDTETARWDDSAKYVFTYGPFHAAGMYTTGGQDTPMVGNGYGANAGVTYMGFSVDGFYTKENGAVSLGVLPTGIANFTNGLNGLTNNNTGKFLAGTITNNEAWDVMAKYTFNVPSFFGAYGGSLKDAPCGGYKDAPCPTAKLTFYGGFQEATLSNPDHYQEYYNGFSTIGGYQYLTLISTTTGASSHGLEAFGSNKVLDTAWTGVKYEDGPWTLAAAYYYWHQDSYLLQYGSATTNGGTANNTCYLQTTANVNTTGYIGNRTGKNCAGDLNEISFLVDYAFNKHIDLYGGVTYSEISGGIANGYLQDNNFMATSGIRIRW